MKDLSQFRFGAGAAQFEGDPTPFFYRSFAYLESLSPFIFLILGLKGAGKSSIFKMLQNEQELIPAFSFPNRVCFDEPSLHAQIHAMEGVSHRTARGIWRLYFASLLAKMVIDSGSDDKEILQPCQRFLRRWRLVDEVPTDWQLKNLKGKFGLGNWVNVEFPLKEPLIAREADVLIATIDNWLRINDRWYWILLDGLDEVTLNGYKDPAGESVLYALMGVFSEILRTDRIRLKLFFRSDQYNDLSFVNKDHFSASKVSLQWTPEDLASILANRLLVLHEQSEVDSPQSLIDQTFEWSAASAPSFEALCAALTDGNGLVLPRDIILFAENARKAQVQFNTQKRNQPPIPRQISAAAIAEGLQATRESKLHDFLMVLPNLAKVLERMKGAETSTFSRADLIKLLGVDSTEQGDLAIAEFVPLGLIEVTDAHAVNFAQSFRIPEMYAKALKMGENKIGE